jgi:endonuclease YncB( thermonuclease family)
MVIEGARAVDGDQLHVRDHEGRTWTIAFKPGDDPEVGARRLLREKFGKHHAFYQTIYYPVRSFH